VDKATLRKEFLEKRSGITRSQYWVLNDDLIEQVKLINWSQYQLVHVFLPIRKNLEVDTFSILNYFKCVHPYLKIVIPRTDFEQGKIVNVLYDHEYTILRRNNHDIPEPIYGKIIPADQIDFIFIPLLAYDKKGNRAGYGKGFYDRLLATCRPDLKKAGLSFFEPVEEISDISSFDVKLDLCISPGKTWVF
jgi:5-formyltetrahydrofolate cyclo-ligase